MPTVWPHNNICVRVRRFVPNVERVTQRNSAPTYSNHQMHKLQRATHRFQYGLPHLGLGEEGAADTGAEKGCSFPEARKLATTNAPSKFCAAVVRTTITHAPRTADKSTQTYLTWPSSASQLSNNKHTSRVANY